MVGQEPETAISPPSIVGLGDGRRVNPRGIDKGEMGRDRRSELLIQKSIKALSLDGSDERISRAKGRLRKKSARISRRGSPRREGRRRRRHRGDHGAGLKMKESFNLSGRIQRRVNIEIRETSMAPPSAPRQCLGDTVKPRHRSRNPDVRCRRVAAGIASSTSNKMVPSDKMPMCIPVIGRRSDSKIRRKQLRDKFRRPKGADARCRILRTQLAFPCGLNRRRDTASTHRPAERLIQIIHFDQGDTGRVIGAAHDRRVVAGASSGDNERRFMVVCQRQRARR